MICSADVDALYTRASRYYHESYMRTGHPPETFRVTSGEFAILQAFVGCGDLYGPYADAQAIYMHGMRILYEGDQDLDSERSSLEAWVSGVDTLVASVRRDGGER